MERLLRHRWILDFATIAACAALLAHAAARAFDPGVAFAAAPAHRRPATPVNKAPPDVDAIVARNVFCSSCRGARPEAPVAAAPEPTALPLAVLAIMYAPPPRDPKSSLAVVRDTEDLSIHAVGIGDPLRDATVVDVGPTRILLRRGEATQYLDLLVRPGRPPATPAVVAVSADPLAAEIDKGIRKLAERSYEIDRATLNAVLANTPALVQGARIFPELRDGKSVGFRLQAVRPDSAFARIGLRSGDVISAVNGLALATPESGLDAFVKLRSASHLSLGLERDGQRLTHEYRIR